MATWTQFTAFLDGTRSIRKVERDEIYDNLATLLSTSGCSSAGYSLDSADLTTVKGTGLMTDRAKLNGPGATVTRDRLQNLFATASTAFSNYSTAVSTALSGEGITSTQRDAYVSAEMESFHLWNYYKRLIDALTCSGGCPTFSVEYRSQSASLTKCGLSEYGTPSSPPRIYLTKTQSGAITENDGTNTRTLTWGGSLDYSRPGCGVSDGRTAHLVTSLGCDFTFTAPSSYADFDVSGPWVINGNSVYEGCGDPPGIIYGPAGSVVTTATSKSVTASNSGFSGSASVTLTNEYTTATLSSDVSSATLAAAFTAYSTTPITAIKTVSSDEMTISMRFFQFRVLFGTAAPSGCKLEWDQFLNGSFNLHNCVNIAAGATQYVSPIQSYPFGGSASGNFSVGNFAINSGAC